MGVYTNFEIVAHGYEPNSSKKVDPEAFIQGRIKTSGLMEKCVHWLSDKNVPLFSKIALVFSVTLAALGTGLLIGYPILFSAAVLVPLAIWGKLCMNELARKTIEEYRQIPLAAINEAFGGQQAQFPVLDSKVWENVKTIPEACAIGMQEGATIQGKTQDGRPVFGLKVVPAVRELEADEKPTILAIYQRYNDESILDTSDGSPSVPSLFADWRLGVWAGFDYGDFNGLYNLLDARNLEMIQQIFVHKNHPKWKLAE